MVAIAEPDALMLVRAHAKAAVMVHAEDTAQVDVKDRVLILVKAIATPRVRDLVPAVATGITIEAVTPLFFLTTLKSCYSIVNYTNLIHNGKIILYPDDLR